MDTTTSNNAASSRGSKEYTALFKSTEHFQGKGMSNSLRKSSQGSFVPFSVIRRCLSFSSWPERLRGTRMTRSGEYFSGSATVEREYWVR
eukprot:28970-Eustigmatos_ZCMA.PRE.1